MDGEKTADRIVRDATRKISLIPHDVIAAWPERLLGASCLIFLAQKPILSAVTAVSLLRSSASDEHR